MMQVVRSPVFTYLTPRGHLLITSITRLLSSWCMKEIYKSVCIQRTKYGPHRKDSMIILYVLIGMRMNKEYSTRQLEHKDSYI